MLLADNYRSTGVDQVETLSSSLTGAETSVSFLSSPLFSSPTHSAVNPNFGFFLFFSNHKNTLPPTFYSFLFFFFICLRTWLYGGVDSVTVSRNNIQPCSAAHKFRLALFHFIFFPSTSRHIFPFASRTLSPLTGLKNEKKKCINGPVPLH